MREEQDAHRRTLPKGVSDPPRSTELWHADLTTHEIHKIGEMAQTALEELRRETMGRIQPALDANPGLVIELGPPMPVPDLILEAPRQMAVRA
jgi:hypothetical protein